MIAARPRSAGSICLLGFTICCVAVIPPPVWGQSSTDAPASDAAASAAETTHLVVLDDVRYREGDSDAWRLDLAMPEDDGDELRPAIVIVHGGGWRAGSKRDRPYRVMLIEYALQGYVTISIDYRLLDEAPFPACIEDVKCAVRWLRAHADEFRVDPERIGCYGHSAGAHLSMMLALCPADAGFEGAGWEGYSSAVTAAAGGATPTVLSGRRFENGESISPITYVTADAPPILLLHGTEDDVVPVDTADAFIEKLKEVGADDVIYVRIDGGNHGTAFEHYMMPTQRAMLEFFDRTLKGKE